MGRICKQILGIALSCCLAVMMTPASAFAGVGVDAKPSVSDKPSHAIGQGTAEAQTTINGKYVNALPDTLCFKNISGKGPYTKDTIAVPVAVDVINGHGAVGDYTVTWSRTKVADVNGELTETPDAASLTGASSATLGPDNTLSFTYNLKADLDAGLFDSDTSDGARWHYYVTVTNKCTVDGVKWDETIINDKDPIVVFPHRTDYSKASIKTGDPSGGTGSWLWMLSGAGATDVPMTGSDGTTPGLGEPAGSGIAGVLHKDAILSAGNVDTKGDLFGLLSSTAAGDASTGDTPLGVRGAWQLSVAVDRDSTSQPSSPFMGNLRVTLDVTDYLTNGGATTVDKLVLYRTTDGANVERVSLGSYPGGAKSVVVNGRTYITFTIDEAEFGTGALGAFALAAPTPAGTRQITVTSSVVDSRGGTISPLGDMIVTSTGSVTYRFEAAVNYHMRAVYVQDRTVAGDGATNNGQATIAIALSGASVSAVPIGTWAANSLTLDMTSSAFAGVTAVKIAVLFDENPAPPVVEPTDYPVLSVANAQNGTIEVAYTDKTGALKSVRTSNSGAGRLEVKDIRLNSTVFLMFKPADRFVLGDVKVNDIDQLVSGNSTQIEMFASSTHVVARFVEGPQQPAKQFTVAASVDDKCAGMGDAYLGEIDGEKIHEQLVDSGTTVTFDIAPADGYAYEGATLFQRGADGEFPGEGTDISGWAASSGRSLILPGISADTRVVFRFKEAPATINVDPELIKGALNGGAVSPVGIVPVDKGDTKRIVLTPEDGKKLADGSKLILRGDNGASKSFTYTEDGSTASDRILKTYAPDGSPIYYIDVPFDLVDGELGGSASLDAVGAGKDGSLFTDDGSGQQPVVQHKVTTRVDSSGHGSISLGDGGSMMVDDGGSVTVYLFPDDGYKTKSVTVTDRSAGASADRVRTFHPQVSLTISNITSDTSVVATFEAAKEGEDVWTVPVEKRDVIEVASVEHGSVDPASGTTVTLPQGGRQKFDFAPDDGYEIGKITLQTLNDDGSAVVSSDVVATGVSTWTYSALGGRNLRLEVEFVKKAEKPSTPGGVGNTVDAEIEAEVEVVATVNASVGGDFIVTGQEDASKMVDVDMPHQVVPFGGTVEFTVTFKDVDGKYFTLHDIDLKGECGDYTIEAIKAASRSRAFSGSSLMMTSGVYRLATAAKQTKSFDSDASAFHITISNVQSDIQIGMQVVETDKPVADRPTPDKATVAAFSEGGGWVVPLLVYGNENATGASKPSLDVYQGYSNHIEFVPFAGHYLKSVTAVIADSSFAAQSGAKAVNLFGLVSNNSLDIGQVFDVLGISGDVFVRLDATFALDGDMAKETVTTHFEGAWSTDGGDGGAHTVARIPDSLVSVEPAMASGGADRKWPIKRDQSFTFKTTATSVNGTSGGAETLMLDHLVINNVDTPEAWAYPLPGASYITLPMDTDISVRAIFRERNGEPDRDENRHTITLEQPAEGGSVTVGSGSGGSTGPVEVIEGSDQTISFNPTQPSEKDEYFWILDEVLLDGEKIVSSDTNGDVVFENGGRWTDTTHGLGLTKDGEQFKLDFSHGTITIFGITGPHSVSAKFSRAVKVTVECNDETLGVMSPMGEALWKVSVVAKNGKVALVPTSRNVYIASLTGAHIKAATVNDVDVFGESANEDHKLEVPAASEKAEDLLLAELNSRSSASSYTVQTEQPNPLLSLLGVKTANAQDVPLLAKSSKFSDIKVYRLSAFDLTKNHAKPTSVKVEFAKDDSPGGNGGNGGGSGVGGGAGGGSGAGSGDKNDDVTYSVTATVIGGHGTLGGVSSLTKKVAAGDAVTIPLTPEAGYVVAEVRDNGKNMTPYGAKEYRIESVNESHEITVRFALPNAAGVDPADRVVRRVTAMLATGDNALPLMIVCLGVAFAAVGVALISSKRNRKKH